MIATAFRWWKQARSGASKIKLIPNTIVDEILDLSKGQVTGIILKNETTGEKELHACEGVVVSIGSRPNTDLFQGQLLLNEGYINLPYAASKNKDATPTSIPGVFAAGDVSDPVYRQAITSAATGCMAALDAEKYLDSLSSA